MSNVFIRNSSVEGFCCCWGFVLFCVFFRVCFVVIAVVWFLFVCGVWFCLFVCFCVSFEGFGWLVCLEVVLGFVHVRINLFLISSLRHRDTTKKTQPSISFCYFLCYSASIYGDHIVPMGRTECES